MELSILANVILLIVVVVQRVRFNSILTQQRNEITDLSSKYHRAVMELGLIKTNIIIGKTLGK